MKNKFFLIILLIFFNFTLVCSQELIFETSEIKTFEEGNIIKSYSKSKIIDPTKIEITADNFTYDRKKSILIGSGNVDAYAPINKIYITADDFTYDKIKSILIAVGNVKTYDLINFITTESNYVVYNNSTGIINTVGKTFLNIDNEYNIDTADLFIDRFKKDIFSKKKTKTVDSLGNVYFFDSFIFNQITNLLKAKKIKFIDTELNTYTLNDGFLNLKSKELLGKDIFVNFKKDLFDDTENDPRLSGNSFYSDQKNQSIVSRGKFTSCKQDGDKCPPWLIQAEKVRHDKINKTVHYKHAWLKIYDTPVMYFPKFYHPDPSVKRRSGLLKPSTTQSKLLGGSFTLPYFHVIDDNQDITFSPRIFGTNKYLLQSEFRKVSKNINHIMDLSYNTGHKTKTDTNKNNSRTHLFSTTIFDIDFNKFDLVNSNIELNIEKTNNDEYLELFNIKSPLLLDHADTYHSYVKFDGSNNQTSFSTSFESYETSYRKHSDRYEFIYPNYNFSHDIALKNLDEYNLTFSSYGNQRKFETNKYEAEIINDLNLNRMFPIRLGMNSKFNYLLKNINTNGKNSSKFKDKDQSEVVSLLECNFSVPLKRKFNFLTPKASIRYSPNQSKNLKTTDRQLDVDSVFSINRLAANDTVEGGESLTLGIDYNITDEDQDSKFQTSFASVFRAKENENLPNTSTINKKVSDVFGKIKITPNEMVDITHNFSIDNKLKAVNYNLLGAKLSLNNFVTTFSFLEESQLMGGESFIDNAFDYSYNENNSFSFSTRKNKKNDLREYYNLIYEYKNDCLTASLKYNKNYYTNLAVDPQESLFFTLTIIPLGTTETENVLPE